MKDYRSAFSRFLAGDTNASGETRAFCPEHENPDTSSSPSASFNFDSGVWNCQGCESGGRIEVLAKAMAKNRNFQNGHDSNGSSNGATRPQTHQRPATAAMADLPKDKDIRAWHKKLLASPQLLGVLTRDRLLESATMEEFQIGHDGQRYTLPIYDADGKLVNVRRYDPHCKTIKAKMISIRGHGDARLFRPDLLADWDTVVICEGEMDMMVGWQAGLPVITHTGGALTFMQEWGTAFAGKTVFICYDLDDSGIKGARKAANILKPHATAVYILKLPMEEGSGKDITDYFAAGNTAEQFRKLMEEQNGPLETTRSEVSKIVPTKGRKVTLVESRRPRYSNEVLEMTVQIAGKRNEPYLVPKGFKATCSQDKGNVCMFCPMSAWNGEHRFEIQENDPVILDLVEISTKQKMSVIQGVTGARCLDRIHYDFDDDCSVNESFVGQNVDQLGIEDKGTPLLRRVLSVGIHELEPNTSVRMVGAQNPDPKNQESVFQAWRVEETQTSLDKFEMTPELCENMAILKAAPGQSPLEKMREIADDHAANVTYIYGRQAMHMACDIVWHSALSFNFLGQYVHKGWLEMMIMGDTRTGKSEVATRLAQHYNAGRITSCEGATLAGLVGGAQQYGGSVWTVKWGFLPLNDRRLVVLDEASSLRGKGIIESMSSIRSSGRAEIQKIVALSTPARTRIIWISNPPNSARLHQNVGGSAIDAITRLMPNPEDVARLDFAMAVTGDDVNISLINTVKPKKVEHIYTSELCEALVLWAWSRTPDQIRFERGVERCILKLAIEMSGRYVSDPPLVQPENIRLKIARIAIAIAARTFSSDVSGELLLVREEHAYAAVEFLDLVYGSEAMGYREESQRILFARSEATKYREQMLEYLRISPSLLQCMQFLEGGLFRIRDMEYVGGMDRSEVGPAIQQMREWRMVSKNANGTLRVEPMLLDILRQFAKEEYQKVEGEED